MRNRTITAVVATGALTAGTGAASAAHASTGAQEGQHAGTGSTGGGLITQAVTVDGS